MHRPPNSLQGDTTDRINDEPWNKIILHQLPVRPTEILHCIRIYDRDTVKTEKMLVQLINTKYSVYDKFYSWVHPRSHPRFTCIFVARPSRLNCAIKDAGKQGREHVRHLSQQQRFPAPPAGPEALPYQAGHIISLASPAPTCLPLGPHPDGCAQNPRSILIICPDHLSWLLSMLMTTALL